ncbi:DEAD/DEAH box helicase [Chryseoglobus sp. 28M-23]|uniref:DEAD/DEAH box helicase n=1 Tax=Chryseoglobus sp. 28M-23 TaxID=2772253 RepID=UPI001746BF9A|nr:DEAD/DEAH box helicase [Chryseoglobus sp. 28M-23]QOD93549.1 DEAD/DEAH box helicase [Chryseoglobus sp. 28M-23]
MPQNKKARPGRASTSARGASGAGRSGGRAAAASGSRSPGHRGYRPEEADAPAKKARWSREERVDRGHAPERSRGDREVRGERAARGGRDDAGRPARDDRGRPARASRDDAGRPARDDRGHPGRPARDDRVGRPSRGQDVSVQRTGTGRTAHRPEWRPQKDAANERPARRFGRDTRPQDRQLDDRGGESRGTRRDGGRGVGAADTRRRDDRPARAPRTENRAPRSENRDAGFYPSKPAAGPVDDVVLERLAADAVQARDVEGVTFTDLGLGGNITRTLEDLGAVTPFPIQAATIPDVLAGKDVLGRGRTGSGKTIAFGAPLVERLMENGGGKNRKEGRAPRALILAPTRELALQIDRTVQPIARSVGLFTTQIYGGVPQARQVGALRRGVDIIIGTPGRIEDLVEQGRLDLSRIEIVVLDEADHMCELGFLEPVQRIIRRTRTGNQKLLFSATLDSGVASLVTEFLSSPSVYEVAGEDQESSTIDHRVLLVEQREKRAVIEQLSAGPGKTLVFARTRAFAEELADQLDDAGIPAVSLHGDLNQARRSRNLEKLTSGRVSVLVATDVAARGIHVDDISLVIQADAPDEYKAYLHRSGRTGRAGKVGTVVTLVTRQRRRRLDELLGRAEIDAVVHEVRAGDALLDELAAL